MALGKLEQALSAKKVFALVRDDLVLVEKEISRESVASVDAITAIGQYLQEAGGKRLRPSLLLLSSKLIGDGGESAGRLGAVGGMIHRPPLFPKDVLYAATTRGGRPPTQARC